jgi:hypothetical protein
MGSILGGFTVPSLLQQYVLLARREGLDGETPVRDDEGCIATATYIGKGIAGKVRHGFEPGPGSAEY